MVPLINTGQTACFVIKINASIMITGIDESFPPSTCISGRIIVFLCQIKALGWVGFLVLGESSSGSLKANLTGLQELYDLNNNQDNIISRFQRITTAK